MSGHRDTLRAECAALQKLLSEQGARQDEAIAELLAEVDRLAAEYATLDEATKAEIARLKAEIARLKALLDGRTGDDALPPPPEEGPAASNPFAAEMVAEEVPPPRDDSLLKGEVPLFFKAPEPDGSDMAHVSVVKPNKGRDRDKAVKWYQSSEAAVGAALFPRGTRRGSQRDAHSGNRRTTSARARWPRGSTVSSLGRCPRSC